MAELDLIKSAPMLSVYKKADHPDVQLDLEHVWDVISQDRVIYKKARHRRLLMAIALDLWVAAQTANPWRAISKNRNDYTKGSRYRRIHWKYDLMMNLYSWLTEAGFIEQSSFKHNNTGGGGYRTRIKATDKFLSALSSCRIEYIKRASDLEEEESIIRKDENKKVIDYEDNAITNQWRDNLRLVNSLIESAAITSDVDFKVLTIPTSGKKKGRYIDPTAIHLYRTFNEMFTRGGRHYGGWWQLLNKEERSTIKINKKKTVELDYKCLHATILYILAGQALSIPEDSYAIPGIDRQAVKDSFFVLFNCRDREQTLNTMSHDLYIKNSKKVLSAIEDKHKAIKPYLYSGLGTALQCMDSVLIDSVLVELAKKGIVCLPVFDSLIVQIEHEALLRNTMTKWFMYYFDINPIIT
ncbi:MAG: hypothetical protein LT080_03335 [Thiobacillus sp.]|nr:hypothetical protein [Thiobacillus sp.]